MTGWHTPVSDDHPAAQLLGGGAVRDKCGELMAYIESGRSQYFTWQPGRLAPTAAYVADTIRRRFPDLRVPYHSRWRHFEAGGVDRWARLVASDHARAAPLHDAHERARVRIDLVIPSVLLDAGAGPAWRYHDADNRQTLARSEGLGVASLALFAQGALSSDPRQPLRADAHALARITPAVIGDAFQVRPDNPLVGLEGRASLLQRLGQVIAETPAVFGTPARLGNLFDYLSSQSRDGRISAAFVLKTLLRALGPVWPGRIELHGVSLGDCWWHDAVTGGLVPFHKLTQWLTYSLLEPLQEGGLDVTDLDGLTGLPEYRNGGLLIDLGLLQVRDPSLFAAPLQVDHAAIVEWRAATVIGLDRVAAAVRTELGLSAGEFPLARVLEGGTWAAGRRVAAEKRADGGPPFAIVSDGTVF
jgi:hypothetical protein